MNVKPFHLSATKPAIIVQEALVVHVLLDISLIVMEDLVMVCNCELRIHIFCIKSYTFCFGIYNELKT